MIPWILAVAAVEAATELIVASEFFFPIRMALAKWRFANALVSCGYCVSVWVSAAVAWALPGDLFGDPIADSAVRTLALHRAANVLHSILSLARVRPGRS